MPQVPGAATGMASVDIDPGTGGGLSSGQSVRVIWETSCSTEGSCLGAVVLTDHFSGASRVISWSSMTPTMQTTHYPSLFVNEVLPVFTPFILGSPYYHSIGNVNHPQSLLPPVSFSAATWNNLAIYGSAEPRTFPRPAIIRAREREAERRGRRALQRSLTLFRRFRPDEELKTFLDGKPLLIHGCQYDYQITKTVDLLQHTMRPESAHIPYDLRIKEKDGTTLAKGCVVFPATPVIDQILALIFCVQDEQEEEKILKVTNWAPRLTRRPRQVFVPDQLAA